MVDVTVEIGPGDAGGYEVTPTSAVLFGAQHQRLDVRPPAPFVPCNPSILWDGARWLCSVRAVDYRLGVPNEQSSSRNYMLELNRVTLSTRREFAILDLATGTPRGVYKRARSRTTGFEDLRLFRRGASLQALATACDLVNGGGTPEMCLLGLEEARGADDSCWTIAWTEVLRGPWSRTAQKNWIPSDRGTHVLYRAYPTLAFRPGCGGNWSQYAQRWMEGGGEHELDDLDFLPASVRGSSQSIRFDGGWLAVVHEHKTKRPLSYVHRFMWWDDALVPRKVSRDFVWQAQGVEFCAGLASDGDRLVASYGVHDMEAWLCTLDPELVRKSLRDLG